MNTMSKVDVVRAACCVAGADSKLVNEERRLLDMLANDVGIGQESLQAMIDRALNDSEFYAEQFNFLSSNPSECIKLLFGTALIDHDLHDAEICVLERLAERLNVPRDQFTRLLIEAEQYVDQRSDEGGSIFLST